MVSILLLILLHEHMAGQKKGSKKRSLKLTRADDDDIDKSALFARSLGMSVDNKRLRTSNPEVCARVDVAEGGSQRIDWTTHFDPMVADTFTPALPVKPRRYANSVSAITYSTFPAP